GDAALVHVMERFGIQSTFEQEGVRIQQTGKRNMSPSLIDCADFPDIAQSLAVAAAGLNMPLSLTGLESLRIKETDRIAALQQELSRFGKQFVETSKGVFELQGHFHPSSSPVKTYDDHRMAMAFAPLSMLQDQLQIENPEVVVKSYPEFWEHLGLLS
ncbi:MAG: 3-phosphoshikimate 1-carboxyvinyltransferase, partial [Bacteroidia bacterium]